MNMFHGLFLGLCTMSAPYVHGFPSAVTVHDQQVQFIRGSQIFKHSPMALKYLRMYNSSGPETMVH